MSAPETAGPSPQVLDGVRVLDLSRWVAGEYATKMFADFGADVVKVEKPGEGSLTRAWGPFPGDVPHPEKSALFLHLNANKRSIALDLRAADDRELLLTLIDRADALVESFRPGHLESLGLAPELLRERNPKLVITRISAFGQTGPYRDREATGLVLQAAGGPMSSTGSADRAPLRKPGLLEHYTIGHTAGAATMAGLLTARRTGSGSVIDVSGQEVLLSGTDRRASFLLAAAYSGANAPRGFPSPHRGKFTFTGKFQAKDGFLMFYVTNVSFWNRLVRLVSDGDTAFEQRFLDRSALGDDAAEFVEHLKAWCSVREKVAIMREGQAAKIPVTAFLQMDELVEHPHFRGRGSFVTAKHPEAGTLDYLSAPFRMNGGYRLRRTAPLLDADRTAILTGELRSPDRRVAESAPASCGLQVGELRSPDRRVADSTSASRAVRAPLPLQGVRVVDLTVAWSGPGAAAMLGDLGAEVIRIEGNNRTSRQTSAALTKEVAAGAGWHANMFPDRNPEPRPYDRNAMFNWHARNKLAACLNLDTPEGHEAALKLFEIADVFVENNTTATLAKLGIGHETLLELNPRLIIARMPPMGLTGPLSNYLGYGPNFNSLVGIAAMDGYEGEGPDSAGDNYHMDEAAPAGLAFAVMAALWDRERTGKGGLIEFAQAENVMQEIGECFLDWQLNGRNQPVLGNTDPHLLQDVFLSADEDRWVAISVRDDRDWAGVRSVIGSGSWLDDGGTAAGRREHSGALRAHIAEWAAVRPAEEIVRELQAHRVPAGEVMTERRLLDDEHLAARGWFQERTHPAVGTYRYPGHPYRADGFGMVYGRPFPSFGEDNAYVYGELLGYSGDELAELAERGLVTDDQRI